MDNREKFRVWAQKLPKKKYGSSLSSGSIASAGLRDYQKLLDSIAKRTSRSLNSQSIETAITNSELANAWAFRDVMSGGVHGVVVTTELIERMQAVCWGARQAALRCLASSDCPKEFKELWGSLPQDDAHAQAFARLLVHSAAVLLMHHELAHIILGHFGTPDASSSSSSIRDGFTDAPVDEAASFDAQSLPSIDAGWILARSSAAYRSQAQEVDADFHAISWTNFYLRSFNRNSASLDAIGFEDRLVAEEVLSKEESIRFILVCSSWALFLALGGRQFNNQEISEGTHPQTGVRLAMLSHVEQQIALERNQRAEMQFGATGFSALIGSQIFQGNPSLQEVLEIVGFKGALENWGAVVKHVALLGEVRHNMQSVLGPRKLQTSLPSVSWWAQRQ